MPRLPIRMSLLPIASSIRAHFASGAPPSARRVHLAEKLSITRKRSFLSIGPLATTFTWSLSRDKMFSLLLQRSHPQPLHRLLHLLHLRISLLVSVSSFNVNAVYSLFVTCNYIIVNYVIIR